MSVNQEKLALFQNMTGFGPGFGEAGANILREWGLSGRPGRSFVFGEPLVVVVDDDDK